MSQTNLTSLNKFKVGDRVINIKQVGNTCIGEARGVVVSLYNSSHYSYPVQVKMDKQDAIGSFSYDELDYEKHHIIKQIIKDLI